MRLLLRWAELRYDTARPGTEPPDVRIEVEPTPVAWTTAGLGSRQPSAVRGSSDRSLIGGAGRPSGRASDPVCHAGDCSVSHAQRNRGQSRCRGGVAYRVDSVFGSSEPQHLADPAQVPDEIERFDRAVAASAAELEAIVAKVAQQLGPAEADIFQGHLQIVNDRALLAKVHDLIATQHLTALRRLQLVLQELCRAFARIEHDYFRERMADIRDVISRIGSHLTPRPAPRSPGARARGDEPVILVAHEILPCQAMSLGNLPIAGIVTETGGGTGHAAILARSLGIPAVSGLAASPARSTPAT